MAAWITVDDLRDYYEGVIPDDERTNRRLAKLVELATARLTARVPSIQRRIEDGSLDKILVEGALAEIILRPIRNPRGVVQEQAGEFSYRLDRAVKAGALLIEDEDIQDLLPPEPGIGVSIGMMRIGLPEWGYP